MKTKLNRSQPRGRISRGQTPKVIDSILTTTDFSPESLTGVKYAGMLAAKFHSELSLLHVIEPPPRFSGFEKVVIARGDAAVEFAARAKLANLLKTAVERGTSTSCFVTTGKAFDRIVQFARTSKVDLIVLSTHGFTGVKRVVTGSTTEQVVRHAPCPVLTVPANRPNRPLKVKRILVPIDFSNVSKDALPYARLLAEAFSAEIVLGTVIEQYPIAPPYGSEVSAQFVVPMMRAARTELEAIADELRQLTDVKVKVKAAAGTPSQQICIMAARNAANLIVLTTHGYTGLKRMLIGGTAERVVRHATCPVLVVRELQRRLAG
jgi:nucleotide-binding universal stress UspA family protein